MDGRGPGAALGEDDQVARVEGPADALEGGGREVRVGLPRSAREEDDGRVPRGVRGGNAVNEQRERSRDSPGAIDRHVDRRALDAGRLRAWLQVERGARGRS